jgi:hypothetical protein
MSKKKAKAKPPFSTNVLTGTGVGSTKFPTDVLITGGIGTGIGSTKITTGVVTTKLPTYVSVKPSTVNWSDFIIRPRVDVTANLNWAVLKFIQYIYRESLPVLRTKSGVGNSFQATRGLQDVVLEDTLDAKKKWYMPEYELKPVAEGGLTFTCEETISTEKRLIAVICRSFLGKKTTRPWWQGRPSWSVFRWFFQTLI